LKKRRNILLFISLCLICSFAIRVYFVNRDVSKPPMKEYKKGEIVTFDEEYSVDNRKISEGYTIQILDSEILSVEDFQEKYNLSEGDLEGQYNFTNAYYVVKAKFTNVNNQEGEEQGISLLSLPLVGKNYMVVFNAIAYPHLNPTMPIGGGFSSSWYRYDSVSYLCNYSRKCTRYRRTSQRSSTTANCRISNPKNA